MSAAAQPAPGRNGTAPTPPVLQIAGLSKTFGATRALIDASLDIRPGEIHALVGQNGSGKSTLIKTLAGYHTPDAGSVAEIDGAPFDLGHAVPDGLRFVHQDLGLVLELNAMDNLALRGGFARGAMGRVRWREQEQETHRVLARFGVDLDIHRPLAAATPVERTVVAIAAALQGWQGGSGVLVLDEPTAVLPHDEVERLFAMVREVRSAGTSVLYVSHRLDEIFELADRVTVLRGGRVIATHAVSDIDAGAAGEPDGRRGGRSGLPRAGGGAPRRAGRARGARRPRPLAARRRPRRPPRRDPRDRRPGRRGRARAPVRARRLSRSTPSAAASGSRSGPTSGATSPTPGDLGIPLVPADRGREGIVAEFAVSENLSLSVLGRLGRRGRLDKRAEAELVERWTERLGVVAAGPGAPISTLSGGNQQKVVVARCLVRDPALLVLCEPTAGVDIGTRVAIYELIAELSRNGLTVVLSSSDAGDVLAMCTRVVVLRGGRVAAELGGEGLTEHALVSAMEGEDR